MPAYTLLFTPEIMPAVNFDVFHFLEKYWRDVTVVEYVANEHLLGVNFMTFGFDSVHFLDNTRSSIALLMLLLLILLVASIRCFSKGPKGKKIRSWALGAILVTGRTIVYMVFVIASIIQLRYNGDDGL